MQVLSDMLWAAGGVNRPKSGKRTAPSAVNWQETMSTSPPPMAFTSMMQRDISEFLRNSEMSSYVLLIPLQLKLSVRVFVSIE